MTTSRKRRPRWITPQTLTGYRKDGIGPHFVEVARKIYYSKEARAEWLANGGTRQAEDSLKGEPEPARVSAKPSVVPDIKSKKPATTAIQRKQATSVRQTSRVAR
jgi:hypothetical protein